MKTDISYVMCVALISLFLLSSVVSIAEGKCAGRWAIHACWGGNGKRSGGVPAMDLESSDSASPFQKLLLRRPPADIPAPGSTVFVSLRPQDFLASLPTSASSSLSLSSLLSSSSSSSSRLEKGLSGDKDDVLHPSPSDRLTSLLRMLRRLQQARDTLA
uniref:GGNG-2 n=1 Tax=Charonia tritonis TaxID=1960912 RepID=A0A1S6JQ25_9CAEN|nr:GGNG-2 precursor [Charonia tritonis]